MGLSDGFYRIKRLPPYVFAQVQSPSSSRRGNVAKTSSISGWAIPINRRRAHIVEKMIEAARKGKNHRYSASRGITKLRHAISGWYKRNYDVELDPETEAIVTIGSKEGWRIWPWPRSARRRRADADADLSHPHVQFHHCRRRGPWD